MVKELYGEAEESYYHPELFTGTCAPVPVLPAKKIP